MSRKEAGKGAGVHATGHLKSHARQCGHYYKQRVPPRCCYQMMA